MLMSRFIKINLLNPHRNPTGKVMSFIYILGQGLIASRISGKAEIQN